MFKFLIIALLISLQAFAQSPLSDSQVDSLSYAQYMAGNLTALKQTVNDALKQGINFYYLRMRIGILYYNNKQYEMALPHFQNAHEMYPADTICTTYLYYTNLFTDRDADARILAEKLPESVNPESRLQQNFLQSFQYSNTLLKNTNIEDHIKTNFRQDAVVAEVWLQGNSTSHQVQLEHLAGKRILFSHQFSYFKNTSQSLINTVPFYTKAFTDNSYVVLSGLSYRGKKGWMLSLSGGYYKSRFTWVTSWSSPLNYQTYFYDILNDYNNFSTTLAAGKRVRNFDFAIYNTFSKFGNAGQFQAVPSITFYPLGNNRLSLNTSLAAIQNDTNSQMVISGKAGFRISGPLWCGIHASRGNHNYYQPPGVMGSWNTVDKIKSCTGAWLSLSGKHLGLTFAYQYQLRESAFLNWKTWNTYETLTFTYYNHLFTSTLKWKF